jgi:hypothetical protein
MTIKQKQLQLKHLGYYKGKIDGIWGNGSEEATGKFQRDYGLTVDKIFGPKTEAKSIEVWKDIQTKLNKHGYNLVVDGLVGTNTINAITDFQRKNGLLVDGIVGKMTMAELNKSNEPYKCKYFADKEFTCKCGCGTNKQKNGIKMIADDIREHFGKPAYINSATRCEKHNKNVGGVSNSQHLYGNAIDIEIPGIKGKDLLAYCDKIVMSGRARYTYLISGSNAVHIDTGGLE